MTLKAQPNNEDAETPLLCDVIERNIRTIIDLRREAASRRSLEDRVSDAITNVSGRMVFVYFHVLWFGLWIVLNTGLLGIKAFDPFPYGLLTMIVSLEAIFLSTFVLISQNRMNDLAERRADLDLHIGLLSEHETTRVLQMLDAIQTKLGIENHTESDLADLEMETKPEDVLAEIERLQHRSQRRSSARG